MGGMTGRRVPAWTIAVPGYRHGEYVLIFDGKDGPTHTSGYRHVHRLTPIWVQR